MTSHKRFSCSLAFALLCQSGPALAADPPADGAEAPGTAARDQALSAERTSSGQEERPTASDDTEERAAAKTGAAAGPAQDEAARAPNGVAAEDAALTAGAATGAEDAQVAEVSEEDGTAAAGAGPEGGVATAAQSDAAQEDSDSAPQDDASTVAAGEPVAGDDAANDELPEPALAIKSPSERLQDNYDLFVRQFEEKRYEDAVVSAKEVVVLSIEVYGREDLQTAKALTNLALAQHKAERYDAAEQNYTAAIEIIESVENRLSEHLVNPMHGLGRTYLESGRPGRAVSTFENALHVSQVNEGPQNLEQVKLLDALSESFAAMNKLKDLEEVQRQTYALYERRYDEYDERLVPALYRRARWLMRTGKFPEARIAYQRIVRIIEENHGPDHIELIKPLTGFARTYLLELDFGAVDEGEVALRRAARIAEEHPESTPVMHADALLRLGDYYVLLGSQQKARRTFRKAWDVLSDDEELVAARNERFDDPVRIRASPIRSFYDRHTNPALNPSIDRSDLEPGVVVVSFDVNTRGRPENIEVIESQPPGLMESAVIRKLRRTVYRPRYVERQPERTKGLTLRHPFLYSYDHLPERTKEEVREWKQALEQPPEPAAEAAPPPQG